MSKDSPRTSVLRDNDLTGIKFVEDTAFETPTNRLRFWAKNKYSPKILQQLWLVTHGNKVSEDWRTVPMVIEENY